jgi:hypothetical protein
MLACRRTTPDTPSSSNSPVLGAAGKRAKAATPAWADAMPMQRLQPIRHRLRRPESSTVSCCQARLPPGRPPNHCATPATTLCPCAQYAPICFARPLRSAEPYKPSLLPRVIPKPLIPDLERPRSRSRFSSDLAADSLLPPSGTRFLPQYVSFHLENANVAPAGRPYAFPGNFPSFR